MQKKKSKHKQKKIHRKRKRREERKTRLRVREIAGGLCLLRASEGQKLHPQSQHHGCLYTVGLLKWMGENPGGLNPIQSTTGN